MKRVFQLLLLVAIAGLGYWIYDMIAVNVNAEDQIREREGVVIEKAKTIRDLVQAYKDSRPDKKHHQLRAVLDRFLREWVPSVLEDALVCVLVVTNSHNVER